MPCDRSRRILPRATFPLTSNPALRTSANAKEVLGGLVLTDDGLQWIAIDREHVRTFVGGDASR
jgi:hypothetical protein